MAVEASDYVQPEDRARMRIDADVDPAAGWVVQDYKASTCTPATGVAVRELVTTAGPGRLRVVRQPAGRRRDRGQEAGHHARRRRVADGQVPDQRARRTAGRTGGRRPPAVRLRVDRRRDVVHLPARPRADRTPGVLVPSARDACRPDRGPHRRSRRFAPQHGSTTSNRSPPVDQTPWLRDAQHAAITNLEQSLQDNKPRALIQMATGSGKTFAAANIAERLITQAGAQRILFLVDRANLGKQTLKEFQGFDVPGTGRKFSELYNVQRLGSNHVDPVAKVCISTIQRVYSILRGDDDARRGTRRALHLRPRTRTHRRGRLQPAPADRGVRRDHRRRVPPLDLRGVAPGARVLRRLPHRPHRHTRQADVRVLQPEPRHGVRLPAGRRRRGQRRLRRVPTLHRHHRGRLHHRRRPGLRHHVPRTARPARNASKHVDEDLTYDAPKRSTARSSPRTRSARSSEAFRDNLPAMFPDRDVDEHGRLVQHPQDADLRQGRLATPRTSCASCARSSARATT